MCERVSMCTCATCMQEPEKSVGLSGTGVTGSWESADMEAGKPTQAFERTAGTCSCWTISPVPQIKIDQIKRFGIRCVVEKRLPVTASASNDRTKSVDKWKRQPAVTSAAVLRSLITKDSGCRGHRGLSLPFVYRLCRVLCVATWDHWRESAFAMGSSRLRYLGDLL